MFFRSIGLIAAKQGTLSTSINISPCFLVYFHPQYPARSAIQHVNQTT